MNVRFRGSEISAVLPVRVSMLATITVSVRTPSRLGASSPPSSSRLRRGRSSHGSWTLTVDGRVALLLSSCAWNTSCTSFRCASTLCTPIAAGAAIAKHSTPTNAAPSTRRPAPPVAGRNDRYDATITTIQRNASAPITTDVVSSRLGTTAAATTSSRRVRPTYTASPTSPRKIMSTNAPMRRRPPAISPTPGSTAPSRVRPSNEGTDRGRFAAACARLPIYSPVAPSFPSSSVRQVPTPVPVQTCYRDNRLSNGQMSTGETLDLDERADHGRDSLGRAPLARVGLRHRRAVGWGVDGAGNDGVHPDPIACVLRVQGVGERDHPGFRGDVPGRPGERAQRSAGRCTHDRATSGGEQVRHHSLRDQVRRTQVEPELVLEVLDRGLVHPPTGGESADQVHECGQWCAFVGGRECDDIRRTGRIEGVGEHRVQRRIGAEPG